MRDDILEARQFELGRAGEIHCVQCQIADTGMLGEAPPIGDVLGHHIDAVKRVVGMGRSKNH